MASHEIQKLFRVDTSLKDDSGYIKKRTIKSARNTTLIKMLLPKMSYFECLLGIFA